MDDNVGARDCAIRLCLGLVVVFAALLFGEGMARWLAFVGMLPVTSAIFGHCPGYALLGARATLNGAGDRWKLSRAGIINVYQYADETLHFGDGRLLLRGVNGSGKSTAMNMLLPFLLDGEGRVVAQFGPGLVPRNQLEPKIRELLDAQGAGA